MGIVLINLSAARSIKEWQHVKKGKEIGFFQFGGSAHCLVFRRGVIADFALQAIPHGESDSNSPVLKVNSLLAIISA
jgi:phosphatidylserine decarboxylase